MKEALSILFIIMLLVGCSSNSDPKSNEKSIENETQIENSVVKKDDEMEQRTKQQQTTDISDEYQPNSQVTDDRSLLKVGQSYTDDKGEATLKVIKKINKTYKVGSIELTVREAKLIHLRPDYSMIDYFHVLTHDEEFDFVKVSVEIKNKSSEKVSFAPIALLKTNTGETFDWQKDIYLEELNGEIEGNATKFGNLGFIVNATGNHAHKEEHKEARDIKWIEITTSDVFDKNEKKISEAQKIKIEF
ncbi:hypothetical protein ABE322_25745 [Priestia megaterium]